MDENRTVVDATTSSRGAQWAGAGSLIAIAAQSLFGGGNGIGGIFGANGSQAGMNSAMAAELALTKARLDAQESICAAKQSLNDAFYALDKRVTMNEANIANVQSIVGQITKVVIPSSAVCTTTSASTTQA